MHRLGRLAVAASLATALLAGCGSGGGSTASDSNSGASPTTSSAAPIPTTEVQVYPSFSTNNQECQSKPWMVNIQTLDDWFGVQFARSQQDAGETYCMSTYASGDFYVSVMAAWDADAVVSYSNDLNSGIFTVDNSIGEYALRTSDTLTSITGQAGVSVIDGDPTTATKYVQIFIVQGADSDDRQTKLLLLAQITQKNMTS